MSTPEGAAVIDRETARAARLALELMLEEWRLTPEGWREIAGLLDKLSAAVAAGDAAEVNDLTAKLEELSGDRVTRIQDPGDKKVPLPEPDRGRVVALVHVLGPGSPPRGPSPEPARRT